MFTLVLGVILLIILIIIALFLILVSVGNLGAMKLLAKQGVACFSNNIITDYEFLRHVNKEGVAWLCIPNYCYAPVMENKNGFYREHNFLKKPKPHGELYLSNGVTAKNVKRFSKEADIKRVIKDLCVITGSPFSSGDSTRNSNFSGLESYVDKCINGTAKDVVICDDKGKRTFRFAFMHMVHKGMENINIPIKDRDSLLHSLEQTATVKAAVYDLSSAVLILRSYTNITNTTLVLYEIY